MAKLKAEPVEVESVVVPVCTAENKHFIPATLGGVPLMAGPLKCTLLHGHPGDHCAPYQTIKDGQIVTVDGYWSDPAT